MAPEAVEAAPATDYSHLPTDVLRIVFASLLGPGGGEAPLPASEVHRDWLAVRLTCKHWAEVLEATPPAVGLAMSAMPEHLLHTWMLTLPVRALRLAEDADEAWRKLTPPAALSAPLLLDGLEGVE